MLKKDKKSLVSSKEFNSVLHQKSLTPFIKWVGGKSQLLDILINLIPQKYGRYYEPFLGGGALFLALKPSVATVSDLNNKLIKTWNIVKKNPKLLIKNLEDFVNSHSEEFYYKCREKFSKTDDNADIASHFIYLNKTCFNGLYRENSKGIFNVPYNKKDKISSSTIYDKNNILSISDYLVKQDIQIINSSYEDVIKDVKAGDFVFFDPPYDYENENGFTDYNDKGWNKNDTKNLLKTLNELDQMNVKWMITNHNTSLLKEYLSRFRSFVVPVNRFVNSDGNNRNNATYEVIYINYILSEEQKQKYDFEYFIKSLKNTSYFLNKYISWNKIRQNLSSNKILINDLNYLIKSETEKQLMSRIVELFNNKERKECFKILPLFIGKRVNNDEFFYLDKDNFEKKYDYQNLKSIIEFIESSGLKNSFFLEQKINDAYQYLFGVEVGLSNNDKKNKSGDYMKKQLKEF